MTTPTQAQVNAAHNALNKRGRDMSEADIYVVLTAAAEVGAQAKHDAQVDRYVTLGEAMRQQTIERCAQVADMHHAPNTAAAIRALKDE